MERYELVAGASSKFWQWEVRGSELVVECGRIGTIGKERILARFDALAKAKKDDAIEVIDGLAVYWDEKRFKNLATPDVVRYSGNRLGQAGPAGGRLRPAERC